MDKLRFLSLASGSSGNCYYLGNSMYGILIDAGIAFRTIKKRLKDAGIGLEQIYAVFVTHDHFDHIKSIGVLGEKYHLPVYTTSRVHAGINSCYVMTEKLTPHCRRIIENGQTVEIGEFCITSFYLPHDSKDNTGYIVTYRDKTFTFATDLGCSTDKLCQHVAESNYLLLEANYDEEMLQTGRYPYLLKKRVGGDKGHLSNRAAAEILVKHATERLSRVFLCHLSKENNTPELAFETVSQAIRPDVELIVLPRTSPTCLFELG
jgi:phosphoribosyl 1,2-cyclic phosphodiesterase